MRYLILTYYRKANDKIDEGMVVANKIKTKDWQTANVILDFKELKVLKSYVDGQSGVKDWDTVVGYYYQFYANVIERLLNENGHVLVQDEPAPNAEESRQTA